MTLFLLLGCADYALSSGARGEADTGGDAAYDTAPESADSDAPAEPDHWVLDGLLTLAEGVPGAGELRVRTVRAADDAAVCDAAYASDALVVATAPDPSVYAWWEGATATAPGCAGAPDTLDLGVGVLLPDLRARLGAVGLDAAGDAIYGAYVRDVDGVVRAFGAAGTEAALRGEGVATAPPPDGAYQLVPLYALAIAEE